MNRSELLQKLKALGKLSKGQRNQVVCSLIGHSRIQTHCFGYYNCGRCGDQVGDSLGSTYSQAAEVVVIDHNCKTCRANYRKMTWQDKLYTPNPFPRKRKRAA